MPNSPTAERSSGSQISRARRSAAVTGSPLVDRRRGLGDYVVATVTGEGVHGIGPHSELTWFVPGSGHLTQSTEWARDVTPQTLGVQDGSGSSTTASVVFSVADGRIVKPVELQDQRLGRAIASPGGFGYELHNGGDGADRWHSSTTPENC